MDRQDLQHLSKEQLIELVLQLQRPDKTSRTSSKPPSTDRKEKRENARPGGAKPGHEPHNRRLTETPDEVFDHMPLACERCGGSFLLDAERELVGEYDEIEIPPVKPYVVRHRRFACRCGHCGLETKAPAPAVATSTPFGADSDEAGHLFRNEAGQGFRSDVGRLGMFRAGRFDDLRVLEAGQGRRVVGTIWG